MEYSSYSLLSFQIDQIVEKGISIAQFGQYQGSGSF